MQDLKTYDISMERGFLCSFEADEVKLTGPLQTAREIAIQLPQFLPSSQIRHILESKLPLFDAVTVVADCTDAQARLTMVHYSFMVQTYVWGEPTPPKVLPACLVQPIVALADRLGQQPLLPYSGYVLDNWACLDKNNPIDLDNIYMLQNFLGGQDEIWFVLIHVAIEAKAGGVLARIKPLIEAIDEKDAKHVMQLLQEISAIWVDINAIFDRIPERCDPYIYFERVRPYIHGWQDNPALPNGIIYEGVERYEKAGQAFRGQTGSQNSIVPTMDALMGVGHAAGPLKSFLDQLHIYRPPAHRQFIDDVRKESTLRSFAEQSGDKGLIEAYNANIEAVAKFRSKHLEYAASYINKQGKTTAGNDNDVGTGGTPFMRYLKKHRDETAANLLPA